MRPFRRSAALAGGLVLVLAGCGPETPPAAALPTWERPEGLFIAPAPGASLVVEVDTIGDAEPVGLDGLVAFLERRCSKPAGIRVVRDETIPVEVARGLEPEAVARRHMSRGPVPDERDVSYLYVLFFPGEGRDAYVPTDYPAAIFVDAAAPSPSVVHAAGHALGLVRGARGDGAHCPDDACLLRPGGTDDLPLCAACDADLRAARERPADPKLSFAGPVLVRREPTHAVLRLPDAIGVVRLETGRDVPLAEIQEFRGRAAEAKGSFFRCRSAVADATGPDAVVGPLEAALEDPDPAVRFAAVFLLADLAAKGRRGPGYEALRRRAIEDRDAGVRGTTQAIPELGAGP